MLNQAIIRGFVADDPYIRAIENGKLARLRVATIERLTLTRSNGEVRQHTEWHTISMWGAEADFADKHIRIGAAIEIIGALRTREWEGRDGVKHRTTEIVAQKLTLLDKIEGYTLPPPIAERKAILYPEKRTPSPQCEVKAPNEDPDGLPF